MKSVEISATQTGVCALTLNRPEQRNALNEATMDALIHAIDATSRREDLAVVLVRGHGLSFCAGFDLAEALARPGLMSRFIEQIGAITRGLRRLPQVVVAAVQGAALAGGCAIASSCDLVVATPDAQFGYPVHRIGVSPAVSIPTLRQTIGDGRCRATLMGGRIVDGREAHRIGLVSHLAVSVETLDREASGLCRSLALKGPLALRTTKRWINELDGSLDDATFDAAVAASATNASEPESARLLRSFWSHRLKSR